MPRRPPEGRGPDEWAAWRVGVERERRGWSQGELARLVTEAGVPMQQQAIWKIENGDPPRKISYGEALAFTTVFGLDSVAELGKPPEESASAVVNEIMEVLTDWKESELAPLLLDVQFIQQRLAGEPEVWREAIKRLRWESLHLELVVAQVKEALGVEGPTAEEQERLERIRQDTEERTLRIEYQRRLMRERMSWRGTGPFAPGPASQVVIVDTEGNVLTDEDRRKLGLPVSD